MQNCVISLCLTEALVGIDGVLPHADVVSHEFGQVYTLLEANRMKVVV